MEAIKFLSKILALPLMVIVWIYERTFFFDHGLLSFLFPYGYCKFYPSCSTFAIQVLKKEGILGCFKIINRVLSCTPSSLGGIDYPYADKH